MRDDDSGDEGGERRAKKMRDPKLPTQGEVDAHNVTHLL